MEGGEALNPKHMVPLEPLHGLTAEGRVGPRRPPLRRNFRPLLQKVMEQIAQFHASLSHSSCRTYFLQALMPCNQDILSEPFSFAPAREAAYEAAINILTEVANLSHVTT